MRFASASVPASGFSHATCFPASSAAIDCSACTWFGVETSTRSTASSATADRQSVVDDAHFHLRANAFVAFSSRAATTCITASRGRSKNRFTLIHALE